MDKQQIDQVDQVEQLNKQKQDLEKYKVRLYDSSQRDQIISEAANKYRQSKLFYEQNGATKMTETLEWIAKRIENRPNAFLYEEKRRTEASIEKINKEVMEIERGES